MVDRLHMSKGERRNQGDSTRSTRRQNAQVLWPAVIASWKDYPPQLTLDSQRVGGKAVGLFQLPAPWVPRFIVLTQAFQERFKRTKDALRTLRQLPETERELISEFVQTGSIEGGVPRHVLIRSNSSAEDLLLRGAYKSYPVTPTDEAIADGLSCS